jgi:hypothetical protein
MGDRLKEIKHYWELNKEVKFTADPITEHDIDWLIKTIEEQRLDIKALSEDVNRLSAESGKNYTKLYEIKEILQRP